MLILHVAESYPPLVSGIPEVVSQLSRRMAARGHEVHVCTSAVTGAAPEEILNGVHVHRLPLSGNQQWGIKGDPAVYHDFLRSRSWDVIAAHCGQVWSTDLLLHFPMNVPLLFVAHGLAAYDDPSWKSYFDQLASWIAARNVQMVSLSRIGVEDARFISDHGLRDAAYIENGIDAAAWNTPPIGVRVRFGWQDRPWLVNVSTHSPAKAHHRLFGLAQKLQNDALNPQITQIGRGHPAHRCDLGRFGIKGGCYYRCRLDALTAKGINLMLNVPRPETVSSVKEADIFLLTSEWEASPLVILESMAAGTPFVTFDVGCVREHVGGYVVEDLEEMRRRVRQILASPDLRADLGRQGRQRIAERHDWNVIAGQYEALYRERIMYTQGDSK